MNPDAAKTIPVDYLEESHAELVRNTYREQGRVLERLRILDILSEKLPATMLTEIRELIKGEK